MQIKKIKNKIEKIRDLLLKIFQRLNLQLNEPQTITNMAHFLQIHRYISESYSNKLKSLDNPSDIGALKQIYDELNDVELYLMTRFYHYI